MPEPAVLLYGIQSGKLKPSHKKTFEEKLAELLTATADYEHARKTFDDIAAEKLKELNGLVSLYQLVKENGATPLKTRLACFASRQAERALSEASSLVVLPSHDSTLPGWRVLFLWLFLDAMKKSIDTEKSVVQPFDDWRLVPKVIACFNELRVDEELSKYESKIVAEILENIEDQKIIDIRDVLVRAMHKKSTQDLLGVNVYDGVSWFNKERFEDFVEYITMVVLLKQLTVQEINAPKRKAADLKNIFDASLQLEELAKKSNYRLDEFFKELL